MKIPRSTLGKVLELVLEGGARQATAYLSEKQIVKATRRTFKRGTRHSTIDVVVTAGRPNYSDRKYIRDLVKAGEKFPVRKIRLKWPKS